MHPVCRTPRITRGLPARERRLSHEATCNNAPRVSSSQNQGPAWLWNCLGALACETTSETRTRIRKWQACRLTAVSRRNSSAASARGYTACCVQRAVLGCRARLAAGRVSDTSLSMESQWFAHVRHAPCCKTLVGPLTCRLPASRTLGRLRWIGQTACSSMGIASRSRDFSRFRGPLFCDWKENMCLPAGPRGSRRRA